MNQNQNSDNTAGAVAPAATCSPFFYGQKVTHKLNGTAGIITIKGQKYNAGQTWKVRFERADSFEEVEVWEWEILPENAKDVATAESGSQPNQTASSPFHPPTCSSLP